MGNQVEEVKSKVDIVSLLSEYIDLKKAGRNYKANCPFHGEKTPSFMVSPELQIYKCFGCGESGDVFSFLQKHENMDFGEALKYLADKVGVKLTSFSPEKTSEREKIIEINNATLGFYNFVLLKHPQGKKILDYLEKDRGLESESIQKFKIGYSPDKPGVLQNYLISKKGYKVNDLAKTGLFAGRNFDRFGGRVVFPLMDHRDNIVGFSGRILPWGRQDRAKYINSPETPAYSKSKILYGLNVSKGYIKKEGYAVVVEGELDMISSYQHGVKNVVAIKGSALTEDQIRLISRFCQKIILCLDSDFAGDAAARRGAIMAENLGLEVKVATLKDYKDPDDAARGDVMYYKKTLGEAIGIWDFLIDGIFEKHDLSGEGKRKISREIIPVLELIKDKIVQAHYVEVVARHLSVPFESVNSQLGQKPDSNQNIRGNEKESLQKPRKQLLEEQLLALFLQFSPKKLKENDTKKLFSDNFVLKIIDQVEKVKDLKKFDLKPFFNDLPKELQKKFSEIFFLDLKQEEIDLVKKELEILHLRHLLEELGVKIQKAERQKDENKMSQLQKEFAVAASKLSELEEEK